MSSVAVDEVDKGFVVQDFVYDREKNSCKEKPPWKICNVDVPRSEVVFFTQVLIIILLLTLCAVKLCFFNLTCEESAIWVSLLSSLVGYILPNPSL